MHVLSFREVFKVKCSINRRQRTPLKKLLSVLCISTLTIVLTTGCTATGSTDEAHSQDYKSLSNKQIHEAIMNGGEKAGWKMTEYKKNEVIAEKFNNDEGEMISVKVHNGHLTYEGEASHGDLEDAIYEELRSTGSEH